MKMIVWMNKKKQYKKVWTKAITITKRNAQIFRQMKSDWTICGFCFCFPLSHLHHVKVWHYNRFEVNNFSKQLLLCFEPFEESFGAFVTHEHVIYVARKICATFHSRNIKWGLIEMTIFVVITHFECYWYTICLNLIIKNLRRKYPLMSCAQKLC